MAFDYHFYVQHMVETAQENLQAVLEKRVPGSIRAEVHVELGSPRETIKKFCRNRNIDLIVMATQSLEGFSPLLLGSMVEAKVRKYPAPVLVIKPGKLFTPSVSRFSPTNLKFL